jgi:putative phosphoesterase
VRIAIVSDVHGSLHALEAVIAEIRQDSPDAVIHGGDLALSGARPAEVIDTIRGLGWPGVVGNTDELLWRPEELASQTARAPRLTQLLRVLFESLAPATIELLGAERIDWLKTLPAEQRLGDVVVVHASPTDLWRAPMPRDPDEVFVESYEQLQARVVVYGHVHRAFVRRLKGIRVANSGSAGMPYDGDPRAPYLIVDDDDVQVRRVTYEVDRDIEDLKIVNYPYASWLGEIRRRGTYTAPPDIPGGELRSEPVDR